MPSKPSRKSAASSKVPDQIWLVCEDSSLVDDVSRFLKGQVFGAGHVPSINAVDPVDLKAASVKRQHHVIAVYPGLVDVLAERIRAGLPPSMALSEISSQRQAVLAVLEKLLGRVTIVSPIELRKCPEELAPALGKRLGIPVDERPKNPADDRAAQSGQKQQGDLWAVEHLLADHAVSRSETSRALNAKFDALTLHSNLEQSYTSPDIDAAFQSPTTLKEMMDRQGRERELLVEQITLMQNEMKNLFEQVAEHEREEQSKANVVLSEQTRMRDRYEARLQILGTELLKLNAYCSELEADLAAGRIWRSPAARNLISRIFPSG